MKKFVLTVWMAVFSIVWGWGSRPADGFTLLVYMNGSNLESEHALATADLKEMLEAVRGGRVSDGFNVVLMMGGTGHWHAAEVTGCTVSADSITYMSLTGPGFRKLRTLPGASVGSPATLRDFIGFAREAFPARNYGLICWNHGAGAVTGFGYDERFADDTSLSLRELAGALEGARQDGMQPFSFIGFDACLMATLETAAALAPYAGYMVASQELEPGGGWNYREVLAAVSAYPDYRPDMEWVCRKIADGFVGAYAHERNEQVTLSVVRLDKVAALSEAVGRFFGGVRDRLAAGGGTDAEVYRELMRQRLDSKSFGMPAFTFYGPDMVDLLDFCRRVSAGDAAHRKAVEACLKEAVVYQCKSLALAEVQVCGLSLYFPAYNVQMAGQLDEYMACGFDAGYLDLVRTFGNELVAGSGRRACAEVFAKADLTEALPVDVLLNTRRIYATLLAKAEDGRWVSYGLDADGITLDDAGQIVNRTKKADEVWNGRWIALQGMPVTAFLGLANRDGLDYSVPVLLNGLRYDLLLRYDRLSPKGRVEGARRIIDGNIPDKGLTDLKTGDEVVLLHPVFDADDKGEPEYVQAGGFTVSAWGIRVDLFPAPKGEYRYGYCLVDLYGNRHYMRLTDVRR